MIDVLLADIVFDWTLPYKSTSTPCSCWLCKGERYNRRKFKKETRLEIAMF